MNNWDYLKMFVQASVEKDGEKQLTNKWLLNIMELVDKQMYEEDYRNSMAEGYPDW